jgi:hypothetical protein
MSNNISRPSILLLVSKSFVEEGFDYVTDVDGMKLFRRGNDSMDFDIRSESESLNFLRVVEHLALLVHAGVLLPLRGQFSFLGKSKLHYLFPHTFPTFFTLHFVTRQFRLTYSTLKTYGS